MIRVLSFLFALCGYGLIAATYYASPTGAAGAAGTELDPKSLDWCAANVVAGDTVKILDGTYSMTLAPVNSGTAVAPITYEAADGGIAPNPIIDGGVARSFVINLISTYRLHHLVFRNLTIQRGWWRGVQGERVGDVLFDSCLIRSNGVTHSAVDSTGKTTYGGQGFIINHTTNITITNCTIEWNGNPAGGPSSSQRGVYWQNSSTNCRVVDSTIRYNVSDGIGFHGSDQYGIGRNQRAQNNTIYGNGRQGILTFQTDGMLFTGNNIRSNGATGIQIETASTNAFLIGNNISSNAWYGEGYESAVWLDETVTSVVESNTMTGEFRPLIVSQLHYNILRRNQMWNNKAQLSAANDVWIGIQAAGRGIHWDSSPVPEGTRSNYWVHNAYHNNGVVGADRGSWYIISAYSSISSNGFLNNIISETAGKHDGFTYDLDAFGRNDFNCYYNTRPLLFAYNYTLAGDDKIPTLYSWAGWKTVSGYDANSITTDPAFMDPANGNLSIASHSTCIDAGGWLTTTRSSGTSTTVPVNDPNWFSAGHVVLGVPGDTIQLEGSATTATVTAIDRVNRTITVTPALTFSSGQGVAYAYSGAAPDIGAYEFPSDEPSPTVKVRVTAGTATAWDGGTAGAFTLTRTTDVGDLNVTFTIGGTAVSGTDYVAFETIYTIPDGSYTASRTVTPVRNTEYTGDRTVVLTLVDGASYDIEAPTTATVTIRDIDTPWTFDEPRRRSPGQGRNIRRLR